MAGRIQHLNCGTLRPFGRRRINGEGSPFATARMVCHCLLVEADRGLALVDTGFGLDDIAELTRPVVRSLLPRRDRAARLARRRHLFTRLGTRAKLDPEETAVRQVAARGFTADDVTDVVLTHLDSDHAGGLRDFPRARVHVTEAELAAATAPASPVERFRYWPQQWAHGPEWVTYGEGGDEWFGFGGVRELDALPEFAFVPLPGHTRGHAGVAIRSGDGWLLHAGDAYFFHGEIDADSPHSTPGVAGFQRRFEVDGDARRRSREGLRRLAGRVEVFCTHDPVEFDRLSAATAAA